MSLLTELKHDEKEPLDYRDITRIIGGRVSGLKMKLVDLEETRTFTIKNFFGHGNNVCAVLLTATLGNRKQRHWAVLIKRSKTKLDFWESLGYGKSLERIVDQPDFFKLLKKYSVNYSTHKFQQHMQSVRTCGLHLICRCLKYDIGNDAYRSWLRSVSMDPDLVVSMLTHIGHKT